MEKIKNKEYSHHHTSGNCTPVFVSGKVTKIDTFSYPFEP